MSVRAGIERVSGSAADGAWVRSRPAVAEAPHPRLARLFAEGRWIVGALCAAALLAMLLSYSREDPGFTHAAATATLHNAGGRVGAWVADISLLLFGVSAYLIACAMLITVARGFRRLHRRSVGADPLADDLPPWVHGVGFLLLIVAATGLEALRLYTLKVALPGAPGGVVGGAVAAGVKAAIGFTGASVLFLVGIAIGLSLFLDFSWLAVAERVGTFFE